MTTLEHTNNNTMIHSVLHFLYVHFFNHTDFIGAIAGTSYGVYLTVPHLDTITFGVIFGKAFLTMFLAVIGAVSGWFTKVFFIQPLHKWLKIKYPNSKFFN